MEAGIFKKDFIFWLIILLLQPLCSAEPDISDQSTISFYNSSPCNQTPQEEWNRTFGGLWEDVGTFCQEAMDGGYIITGYTTSYGSDVPYSWLIKSNLRGDLWLIKTDSAGNTEWEKTFGSFGKDLGFSVQATVDGGYIVTGCKKSFWLGDYDLWLIKTDSKGNKEWDRTFGGSKEDLGFSVQQTKDDGYVITGYTSSFGAGKEDLWLVKIDSDGNKEWDRTFGGFNIDEGASVQQTQDGGYIVTGLTWSYGAGAEEDLWLIKTDSKGNKEWDRTFGGSNKDVGLSVRETKDGGYVVTGYTSSFGAGKEDMWLIKTDSKGNKEWVKTFGGCNYDEGTSVCQTQDCGYIITGYTTESEDVGQGYSRFLKPRDIGQVWLIKTDSKGNENWNKTFFGSDNDWGNSVQETKGGGYIITGVTESYGSGSKDVWLIKV